MHLCLMLNSFVVLSSLKTREVEFCVLVLKYCQLNKMFYNFLCKVLFFFISLQINTILHVLKKELHKSYTS